MKNRGKIAMRCSGNFVMTGASSKSANFSYTNPTSSSIDADFDEAPVIAIFPDHLIADFPRFRARQRYLSQAIDLPSVKHLI